MAVTLPTVSLDDLSDVEKLPSKVRTVEPVKSPYQPLIQASLDAGKSKAFPGEYSLTPESGSKTSAFTAITRELGRAARQMGLRVKTRKIVNKDNADLVTIVFQSFRDENKGTASDNGNALASDAAKPAATNTDNVVTGVNGPNAKRAAAQSAQNAPRQTATAR